MNRAIAGVTFSRCQVITLTGTHSNSLKLQPAVRDNIHEVRGGTKCGILLDLFTYFNPQARSYELDVVDAKVDAKVHPQIRRVAWRSEG